MDFTNYSGTTGYPYEVKMGEEYGSIPLSHCPTHP